MNVNRSATITNVPGANVRTLFVLLLVTACVSSVGCTNGNDGPERFTVSGTITYQGQPVPLGFIRFDPDTSKGNRGPGGGAPIKDGRFETLRDKGLVGGPYVIRITGTDGIPTTQEGETLPEGKLLFSMQRTQFEFPKEDTEWNFEVPGR